MYLYGPMADGAFAVWMILLTMPAISVIVWTNLKSRQRENRN